MCCERAAAIGAEGDGVGASAGVHDSHQAAEGWRPGASDSAKGLDIDGFQLSVAGSLSAGLGEPTLLTRPSPARSNFPIGCRRNKVGPEDCVTATLRGSSSGFGQLRTEIRPAL